MDYSEVLRHFGNQGRIAAALGIKQPSVALWKKRGIPELRQIQIQMVTGGLLRACTMPIAEEKQESKKTASRC